jgi:Cu2+-exporting ATPase
MEEGKIYTCPMHPEIREDKPGICPECGMSLVPVRENPKDKSRSRSDRGSSISQAKSGHAGHSVLQFAKKFWISLALTIPVLLYSELPKKVFGFEAPSFPGSDYLSLVLASIVFFYCGWIFLAGAWREIRAKLPGMMTLIALAVSSAYIYSVYVVISGGEHTLFWELATLVTIMLLGHLIEMKAVQGAQGALRELSKLLPDKAEVIRNGKTETIALQELKQGDVVFVRPGGKIPADGEVTEGKSDVNEAMVTGESKPVTKATGVKVIAGTINGDGSLKIRVSEVGEKTFLAGVMKLVAEAQASKSRLQLLADRAALVLTFVAVFGGGITFASWLFLKAGIVFSLERLVAVLVVACPHALGLAIPLVASISTTLAARNGLLVRERRALEAARDIDVVLFDKTGTLTRGEYGVMKIWKGDFKDEKEMLWYAASVDFHSEHFISRAIIAKAKELNLNLSESKDFVRIPGKGVKGKVQGVDVYVGGAAILSEVKRAVSGALEKEISEIAKQGKTIIYVIANGQMLGAVALSDLIREESREAVSSLKKMGVKVAMITGDSEEVAKWVSKELGIDEYFARVLPGGKAEKVKMLQVRRLKVAMVGDGINDAPALTQADLGIAIGAGTNVAIESAGIILVRNDPRDIPKIIKLSRATYAKMIQNLFWATGYNVIAIPLAAGVLYSQGIVLEPAVAALLMSVSTVIVAFNAMMLRRLKL